jgi:hypothetical protein
MSEQVNVVAILTPAPRQERSDTCIRQGSKGGLATNTLLEVLELLEQLVKKVQEEDGILQYDLFWNEQAQDVVFIEK